MAEAFDLAGEEFLKHGAGNGPHGLQILYVLSDGKPYQNEYGPYAWPKYNEATYLYSVVPERSLALKLKGIKILIVAVPSRLNSLSGTAPNIAYFDGVPQPNLRPDGNPIIISTCLSLSSLNCQCAYFPIQRSPNKIYCTPMRSPPFPVESVGLIFNATWENIVNATVVAAQCGTVVGSGSDSPTHQPTHYPTANPTRRPTHYPTANPTPRPHLSLIPPNELDLYVLLDNSRSMVWHSQICANAPGADTSVPSSLTCWSLFLGFVKMLVQQTLALGSITWEGNQSNPAKGLRVTVYGFSCAEQQTAPVTINIGINMTTQAEFDAAMVNALQFVPTGGTCPGQTVDTVVEDIQFDPLSLARPTKAVILITDGIFYDDPRSTIASKGLQHFCAQLYALGLPGGEHGLSEQETKVQSAQLTSFTKNASHVYNFGLAGYNLLGTIAHDMVSLIDGSIPEPCWNNLLTEYDWCGYTSENLCTLTSSCKWSPTLLKCFYKDDCSFPFQTCPTIPYCIWTNGKGCQFSGAG
jgi:hypothetical protein